MKKAITVLMLFTSIVMLVGCMKEDRSGCAQEHNLILHFQYRDGEGNDMLDTSIDLIDLIFFDSRQRFYSFTSTSVARLDQNRCIKLNMEPGDYYIVGWGNIQSERDAISALDPTNEFGGVFIPLAQGSTITPLYYAPDLRGSTRADLLQDDYDLHTMRVEPGRINEHTVSFMAAHHIVNVYLKNFPELTQTGTTMPQVRVSSLPDGYDLLLNTGANTISLTQQAATYDSPDGETLGRASFNVPHFHDEDNVTVTVEGAQQTNYEISVTMREILEKLDMQISDGGNHTIEVMLTYGGVGVEITLPEWLNIGVGGGFGRSLQLK